MCVFMPVHILRSEDNVLELVFSSHYVGSRSQTRVIRFGVKHLSLMSHLASLFFFFLKIES